MELRRGLAVHRDRETRGVAGAQDEAAFIGNAVGIASMERALGNHGARGIVLAYLDPAILNRMERDP